MLALQIRQVTARRKADLGMALLKADCP